MGANSLNPSIDLYLRVRAGFVQQGTTLTAWCRAHGHDVSNARQALFGAWNGPKARELRTEIIKASRIKEGRLLLSA